MTFFSGTDTDTLLKEGLDRNHFVSLIVNNAGKYTAAITRKISVNRTLNEDISYKSFNDEEIKKSESTVESVEEVQYFMLDIHIENSNEEQSIEQRLNEIKNKKIINTPSNTLFNIPNRPLTLYNNTYSNDMRNKKEEFKTPSLFDKNDDYNNYEDYNTTKINKNEELDLDSIIDKSSIKSLLYQLITGSIIISNESKIDLNKWVKGMDSLFDKRFKDTNDDLPNFTSWAESYIDYICCGELCSSLPWDVDIDDLSSTIATQLIKELEKLSPNNKYIKKFIKILKRYTL